MKYIERPTVSGKYTSQDLIDYAIYRKNKEINGIKNVLSDRNVCNGAMPPDDHEDYRESLAWSKEIVINVELSTGGDADGYKLTYDKDGQLISGVYYWADWGVYEEVKLSEEELEYVEGLYSPNLFVNI